MVLIRSSLLVQYCASSSGISGQMEWMEEIDRSKVRNIKRVTVKCVKKSAKEGGEGEKVEEIQMDAWVVGGEERK